MRVSAGGTTVAVLDGDGHTPDEVERHLAETGAVVVRSTGFTDIPGFHERVERFSAPLIGSYRGGNTPRTPVGGAVFTSTEYPARYPISLHNELSYAGTWPDRLYFGCLVAARTGGATPLCDGRALLEHLPDPVRERFTSRGVTYHQNLHSGHGLGRSWQDTFETADRGEVEEFLAGAGAEHSWTRSGGLRVTHRRPATREHARGHEVWFNQADQWHPSNLPGEGAADLLDLVDDPADLPHWVTYGDGAPIPGSDLDAVRAAADRNRVVVPWRPGDLVVVDNMAVLHGREAYTGPRRVVVAMGRAGHSTAV
ncbi:TauD/TfdA family dioxygenase [Actinokineospora bangkokensis]|nr:TauD/TfdA family dioxygenase [Actinokineospora bangkokensis]